MITITALTVLYALLGGLLPALLYALSGVFAKYSNVAGIGNGLYVMTLGVAIFIVGLILYLLIPEKNISYKSAVYALISGFFWAAAAALFAMAITKFGIPLSKLTPLNNLSTFFAIILGLWIFSEWQQVNVLKLLVGATLIIAGSVIVSKA